MTLVISLSDPDHRTIVHQLCAALCNANRRDDADRLWQASLKARDDQEVLQHVPDDCTIEVLP